MGFWFLVVGIQTAKLKKFGVKAPEGRFFLRISVARLAGKIEQGEAGGRAIYRDRCSIFAPFVLQPEGLFYLDLQLVYSVFCMTICLGRCNTPQSQYWRGLQPFNVSCVRCVPIFGARGTPETTVIHH